MPNYKTHDLVCVSAASILTIASTQYIDVEHALLFGAAIIITNHYLSPDTDTASIIDYRYGMLRFIWYPYRRMFSHRSIFTHSGPLSASIRVLYVVLWLCPLLLVIPIDTVFTFITVHSFEVLLVLLAACISDTLHTGLDYGTTLFTRNFRLSRRISR